MYAYEKGHNFAEFAVPNGAGVYELFSIVETYKMMFV